MHRPMQGNFTRSALRLLTVVFWVAAVILLLVLAASSLARSIDWRLKGVGHYV